MRKNVVPTQSCISKQTSNQFNVNVINSDKLFFKKHDVDPPMRNTHRTTQHDHRTRTNIAPNEGNCHINFFNIQSDMIKFNIVVIIMKIYLAL